MTTRPLVVDGLWRCLCPSFQSNSTTLRTLRRSHVLNGSELPSNPPHFRRSQSTASFQFDSNPVPTASSRADGLTSSGHSRRTRGAVASHFGEASFPPPPPTNEEFPASPSRRDIRARRRYADPDLVLLPTPELYERLKSSASRNKYEVVINIVKILLKDRRELPNLAMYSAMLLSFTSPQEGTAGKIRKLLQDMTEDGIELDSQACHNALEALAVHPDHLIRGDVLEYMRDRWYTLTPHGHNMVAAGLLRDRQFEQALEKIEDMVGQRIRVQPWVFDKGIYFLLDHGEVGEAYQLLTLRLQNCEAPVSYALYAQFLDTAARLQSTEAAKYVWNSQVIPGYLKPPTSTCLHTLSLASRVGDVDLATDVFRILTERQIIFNTHHYELLLQTYLHPASTDLSAAMNVIVIMSESGMHPTEASLHPLYVYLNAGKARPLEAFTILQSLEASGKIVPTAAVNVCLQSSVEHGNLTEAIEIYKALHTVSKAGPTTNTFNTLFRGCYHVSSDVESDHGDEEDGVDARVHPSDIGEKKKPLVKKDLAMFLASEMLQLGLKPNALTYDRLIHVCAFAGDADDAFAYYEEMRSLGFVGRKGMYSQLIECGLAAGDPRTVGVLKDMRKAGHRPKKSDARAVTARFAEKAEDSNVDGSVGESKGIEHEKAGDQDSGNRTSSEGANHGLGALDDASQQ